MTASRIRFAAAASVLTLAPVLLATPAHAATALHGHKNGYSLTFGHGKVRLVVPPAVAAHDKLDAFHVSCAKRSVIAFLSVRDGTRVFNGPLDVNVHKGASCVVTHNHHKVASMKVR